MSLDGDNSTSPPITEENYQDETQETYEFVAFLLWYVFLVVCCVIPTCCAYRRRRLVEARMAQQQANFSRLQRLQQNNLVLINTLSQQPSREDCTRSILEKLKETSMTVQDCNIETKEEANTVTPWNKGQVFAMHDTFPSESNDSDGKAANENEQTKNISTEQKNVDNTPLSPAAAKTDDNANGEDEIVVEAADNTTENTTSNVESNDENDAVVNSDIADALLAIDQDDLATSTLLHLPSNMVNGDRRVPGLCAICLDGYDAGDQVSWSPTLSCLHVFHTECISAWLAQKAVTRNDHMSTEHHCPVCRQVFCTLPLPQDQAFPFTYNTAMSPDFARSLADFHQIVAAERPNRRRWIYNGNNTLTFELRSGNQSRFVTVPRSRRAVRDDGLSMESRVTRVESDIETGNH